MQFAAYFDVQKRESQTLFVKQQHFIYLPFDRFYLLCIRLRFIRNICTTRVERVCIASLLFF